MTKCIAYPILDTESEMRVGNSEVDLMLLLRVAPASSGRPDFAQGGTKIAEPILNARWGIHRTSDDRLAQSTHRFPAAPIGQRDIGRSPVGSFVAKTE